MIKVSKMKSGNGVMVEADAFLKAGTFLGVFHGPIRRFPVKPDGAVDYQGYDGGFVIDLYLHPNFLIGMMVGSKGHMHSQMVDYINHSCEPNCKVDGPHKLAVVTCRDVARGEELTLDYRSFTAVPVGIQCWCEVPKGEARCVL